MKRLACAFVAICTLAIPGPVPVAAAQSLPAPAHIVIVVEENKPDSAIMGSKSAPYLNALANAGANMTQSFAETHPSEPNYLALFSGNTFGLTSDACPVNAGGHVPSSPENRAVHCGSLSGVHARMRSP